jgi:hypothetical protein
VKAYVNADKPVFMCEYAALSFDAACRAWKPKGYTPILKGLALDAPVTFCSWVAAAPFRVFLTG